MSASRVLALATLFLATTFAQAEWKEFIFPAGNFKVVFPESPQGLRGARRNLHQFSAAAGAEAYADYSPGTDWKSRLDGKRASSEQTIEQTTGICALNCRTACRAIFISSRSKNVSRKMA